MDSVTEFSKVSALMTPNVVLEALHILEHQILETKAVRFLFQKLQKDEATATSSQAKVNEHVVKEIIDRYEFLYACFDSYIDDFVTVTKSKNRDAAILSLICDAYAHEINQPDSTGKIQNDGFDEHMAALANSYYEESVEILGEKVDLEEFAFESIFLAHVHAMDVLDSFESGFDYYLEEDIRKFHKEALEIMRHFVQPQWQIGRQLKVFIESIDRRIVESLKAPVIPLSPLTKAAELKPLV